MSGDFYNLIGDKGKQYLRRVDKINMNESKLQRDIYTVDVPSNNESLQQEDLKIGQAFKFEKYQDNDFVNIDEN